MFLTGGLYLRDSKSKLQMKLGKSACAWMKNILVPFIHMVNPFEIKQMSAIRIRYMYNSHRIRTLFLDALPNLEVF